MKIVFEIEVDVEYEYYQGYPATREDPGEIGGLEITSVKYNEQVLNLTEDDFLVLEKYVLESLEDDGY